MEYAEQRIPVLNEFCVVCDEPHVFQNGPMLRVSLFALTRYLGLTDGVNSLHSFWITNNISLLMILFICVLQPTVCERELCVFAFQTLGVMNEAADEIATGAQVHKQSNKIDILDCKHSYSHSTQIFLTKCLTVSVCDYR